MGRFGSRLRFLGRKEYRGKNRPPTYSQTVEDGHYIPRSINGYIRRKIGELKTSTPCADCKTYFPGCAMHFDHRPETKKRFNIAACVDAYTLAEIEEEIAKCDIVCACCHSIRTWNRQRNPRTIIHPRVYPPRPFRLDSCEAEKEKHEATR